MSIRKRTILAGIAVAGVAAAGGSAFTASNIVPDSVAGYGSATVSGATVTSVSHGLSSDGTEITASTLTFDTAQTGHTVKAGFGNGSLEPCSLAIGGLSATCTYAVGYDVATANAFNVAVSGPATEVQA
jgi:hypothetical protein